MAGKALDNFLFMVTFLTIIAVGIACFSAGTIHERAKHGPVEPQIDTIYVRDTITVQEPVYYSRTVVDTQWFTAVDTLRDTVVVALPREQLEWRDSLATVWASGVGVEVDSVRHFVTERIITKTVQVPVRVKDRWSVGISAGYGASKDGLSPYVGVGVSYALLSW